MVTLATHQRYNREDLQRPISTENSSRFMQIRKKRVALRVIHTHA